MKTVILILLITFISSLHAQNITEWTETNSTLGLGYPVPIPVDTPEPFEGFRTYAGLFSKHQSIMTENPFVEGHIIGQTHYNRDIWAYVFGDEGEYTKDGSKEGVMMINGNIHAREWQSPEVVTGIMELLHENSNDQGLHQFLLENTSIVIVPVNNIDGLLQTQRYPTQSWYPTSSGPRDGRMRRKNMLNVDEAMTTQNDYLFGVDLNRNNAPYWATSGQSSSDVTSIVHHGSSPHSEPETQARLAAVDLVDSSQLRSYTDAHSFSQVHFSVLTINQNRNILQSRLLDDFSSFHAAFGNRWYTNRPGSRNTGIGSTDEYYANTYQIPSWTLEIEPGPAGSVEYGGFGNDGHDGFILPERHIKRVREHLAQTFMVVWYGQAGPPSVTRFRIRETDSNNIVYDAEWDIDDSRGTRTLHEKIIDSIQPGKQYQLLISFNKPMRVRNDAGEVRHLQGQGLFPGDTTDLNPLIVATLGQDILDLNFSNEKWMNTKSDGFESYHHYQDDTFVAHFELNENLSIESSESINWSIDTFDFIRQDLDSDPSSVLKWESGQWRNYEDSQGNNSLNGGADSSYNSLISMNSLNEFPATVQNSGLYFDPNRNGEGVSYELLDIEGRVWLQWYTYNDEGQQQWYSGIGQATGNSISVDLISTNGGVFGENFDPDNINLSSFGTLEIIYSGGQSRISPTDLHTIERTAWLKYTDNTGNKLRTQLSQLSHIKGNPSDLTYFNESEPPNQIEGDPAFTGSWFDPERNGEGFIIQILEEGRAAMVWYTYSFDGAHLWLFDSDGILQATDNGVNLIFNSVISTSGPLFGANYNPEDLKISDWGSVQFELSCNTGSVSYNSNDENYGAGFYSLTKLTHPVNLYYCNPKVE